MVADRDRGLRRRRVGRLAHELDAHELGGDRLAQIAEHGLEQLEGLGLVLVQRVALGIAAEADHRAQVVEIDQVLAPQMVERLQQDRLLDVIHDLGAEALGALGRRLVGGLEQALAHVLVVDALLLDPLLDRQVEVELGADRLGEAGRVPLLGIGLFGDVAGNEVLDHLVAHLGDRLGQALAVHQLETLLEDHLALVVHDVVIFEQVLADVEVARLDLLLRPLERLVDPGMDDRLAVLEAELGQHRIHAVGPEDAHQVVL